MMRQGWITPRLNGDLVHDVQGQLLLCIGREKKVLPAAVVKQATAAKAVEIEKRDGFKPGRKHLKEIKEDVTDELLQKAFTVTSVLNIWIDPVNGWLAIDSSSVNDAEDVVSMLRNCAPGLTLAPMYTQQSPTSAMTQWLQEDDAPEGFTVDQDAELTGLGEGGGTVRYVRHTLEAEEMNRHIDAGKQCTRLALTWQDRISFVLNGALMLKSILPLDVLTEQYSDTDDADEAFDSDFFLMAGEFNRLLANLVQALGGMRKDELAA